MTKSYEDGIMDALSIIDRWRYVGIVSTPINSIRDQLLHLLPSGYIINSEDIVDLDEEYLGKDWHKKDYDQC